MNNLHRELAPISAAAWADIEAEARRTFTRNIAGRRALDVTVTQDEELAAIGTGHLSELEPPAVGVRARRREVAPIVEFRVPFRVSRAAVDDVERGAKDADWQPVKDAAKQLAIIEDRCAIDGFVSGGITGVRQVSSNPRLSLPADAREYPTVVAQAVGALRLVGVGGPYNLLLSADLYTEIAETSDHGYPIREHVMRVVGEGGEITWAPAIEGALLVSTRGGDHALHISQDVSIGYLLHDAETVELYFQESLTFLVHTTEASVDIS